MNMRLLGARTLKEIVPSMVDARSISNHSVAVPEDRLYGSNCESFRVIRSNQLLNRFSDLDEGLSGARAVGITKSKAKL